MRVFLALDLDSEVRGKLAELQRELRPLARRARWVRPEGLHLTLRFFGEVTAEGVESLAVRLSEAFAGLPAFALDFRGCGVFPERGNPRVLWVGVPTPPSALFELQSRAEAVARGLGFAPEKRRFEPHLTMARFRGPEKGIDTLVSSCRDRDLGRSPIEDALLLESRLSPEGSTYERLRVYPLSRA
jgi:RNA 2',3'-cyclic 3'-phosphodiesterase